MAKIYVFLYQNLNDFEAMAKENLELNLCISILEFKSCSFNREWAYHKIYVFLYQNLNREWCLLSTNLI